MNFERVLDYELYATTIQTFNNYKNGPPSI